MEQPTFLRINNSELTIIALLEVTRYFDDRRPVGNQRQPESWLIERDIWTELPSLSRYTIFTAAKRLLISRMGWSKEYLSITQTIDPNVRMEYPNGLLQNAFECFVHCLNEEVRDPFQYPTYHPAPMFTSFSVMSAYENGLRDERIRARRRTIECEVYRALKHLFDRWNLHPLFNKWNSCSGPQRFYIMGMAMARASNWTPDFESDPTNNLVIQSSLRELRRNIKREILTRVDMFPRISSASNSPTTSPNNSPYGYYHQ